MSDLSALLAAIRENPDEDTPRVVLADWLDEFGTTDKHKATAEFVRLTCRMRVERQINRKAALWLEANWRRLVPRLAAWVDGAPADPHERRLAARTGRAIDVCRYFTNRRVMYGWQEDRCYLEFWRGFVRVANFRHWGFADHVLPQLVADQPLFRASLDTGIWPETRTIEVQNPPMRVVATNRRREPLIDATLHRHNVGPAIDFLRGADDVREIFAIYRAGPKNDALQRAGKALSAALIRRAHEVLAGRAEAGVDAYLMAREELAAEASAGVDSDTPVSGTAAEMYWS